MEERAEQVGSSDLPALVEGRGSIFTRDCSNPGQSMWSMGQDGSCSLSQELELAGLSPGENRVSADECW